MDVTHWLSKHKSQTDMKTTRVHAVPFPLDTKLLALRSAKIASWLKKNTHKDISFFLRDIPADPETFVLVATFCHGFELHIAAENVVPLACIANYLEMTEHYCPDNLLKKALTFFEQRVVPSWNETVKAFQSTENVFQQAVSLGLVDKCLQSIVAKAMDNPSLLGEQIKKCSFEEVGDSSDRYSKNARRKLFKLDLHSQNLTTLSLQLYEPTICEMNQHGVPSEYVAASICQYVEKWVFYSSTVGENMPMFKRSSEQEVIEVAERLLPHQRGLLPCSILFKMLSFAIALDASSDCRNGFEVRIGKQLAQAAAKDLLILTQGYAKEVQYDVECVRRILKNFFANCSSMQISALVQVAELMEGFLKAVANDIALDTYTFASLAEMTNAVSQETQRSSDGIYQAISIYLEKHRCLTELEREKVCEVFNWQKMSPEACEHAAKNERLPLRLTVQALFMGHLHLQDTIAKKVQTCDSGSRNEEAESGAKQGQKELKAEMMEMNKKVMELQRDCCVMRQEIERGKKEKGNIWREMKRKFGCISTIHDCHCHVKKKKVHPNM